MIAFSLEYVNKNDDLYKYSLLICEMNGYETGFWREFFPQKGAVDD